MLDSIKLSVTLQVEPKVVYNAWLDSKEHSAFTNTKAEIEKKVGSKFSAGDGYISGQNELLHMNKRIVQSWRTTDFNDEDNDSNLEILFEKVNKGTKVSIVHTNLPKDSGKYYRKGWKDHYFKPMKEYFEESK
ncbi:MAG: SRPBCC domain-containing protein [Ignavibacteriae bacterium]|nr:SRPBCC domain-containing protein [Ignavibacteriota bacterium]MCB9209512.1 SRPBCC domain-containing protein [Ignavibacteriales bacterium]MCB9258155.1 SRPBCC domain-containing protein [Ignavibacteriales bacterium]